MKSYLNTHQKLLSEQNRTASEIDRDTRRPEWLKVRIPGGDDYKAVKDLVEEHSLNTVCAEARCPNIAECWSRKTATFMILGDTCTRSCGFCAVKLGRPGTLDLDEPYRVAAAVEKLGLKHAVITSVNRDELDDGGAQIFAETIRQIRKRTPSCRVEVLIPDFQGSEKDLLTVLDAGPDILNHNTETVARLYPMVRPQARYARSIELLRRAKSHGAVTKSGIMVGLGENNDEICYLMDDLVGAQVDIFTIGQYLQPTKQHLPVMRFVTPQEFAVFKRVGLEKGLRFVESGPLVRSSYHADEHAEGSKLFDALKVI